MTKKEAIARRRYFHQHPELSGAEFETARYIRTFLKEKTPSASIHTVGETGVLAVFSGTEEKQRVLLRCELDALPIQEVNSMDYVSVHSGVSHKCGHDGHMTILLYVASVLESNPPKGDVYLLFQPAEENGEGAKKIIADPLFLEKCLPDRVFALHNVPGEPMHRVLVKKGVFTPAVISANIHFHGKTAHAAEPHMGQNPMSILPSLLERVEQLQRPTTESNATSIITPIYCHIGTRNFGIAAGSGSMGLTFRTGDNAQMHGLQARFMELIEDLGEAHQIDIELEWTEAFSSIVNETSCVDEIQLSAEQLGLSFETKSEPFPWGEDFGLFTEAYQGAMFGLGAGVDTPALHNPDYDFPDELIQTGASMFLKIIEVSQQ